jgi:hypothetical protein
MYLAQYLQASAVVDRERRGIRASGWPRSARSAHAVTAAPNLVYIEQLPIEIGRRLEGHNLGSGKAARPATKTELPPREAVSRWAVSAERTVPRGYLCQEVPENKAGESKSKRRG